MANVTLSIDEEDLKRARIHAIEQGTSLNAVIRQFVKQYAVSSERYRQITESILTHAEVSTASSAGKRWSREEIYER
jgi:ABC-type proline/glycine betaine transport system substrate-binding protein